MPYSSKIARKGQVTAFILVGLIIVATVATGAYLLTKKSKKESDTQSAVTEQLALSARTVQQDVQNCLELATQESARQYANGIAGTTDGLHLDNITVRQLYINGEPAYLKEHEVATILEQLVTTYADSCLRSAREQFTVKAESPQVRITIKQQSAVFSANWNIKLQSEDFEKEIKSFSGEVPSSLHSAIEAANEAVRELAESRYTVGLLDPAAIGAQDIRIASISGETIYVVHMRRPGEPDIYFAFTVQPESVFSGHAPILEAPSSISSQQGEAGAGTLIATDADGDSLRYYSRCPYLQVDEVSGEMQLTSTLLQAGDHSCVVGVIDEHLQSDEATILVRSEADEQSPLVFVLNSTISAGVPWQYTPSVVPRRPTYFYSISSEPQANGLNVLLNGTIVWPAPQVGEYTFLYEVIAGDATGAGTFSINVIPYENQAPIIITTNQSIAAGNPFEYQLEVIDQEPVSMQLIEAPSDMAISAAGKITWDDPQQGTYPITVIASDGSLESQESFDLVVE